MNKPLFLIHIAAGAVLGFHGSAQAINGAQLGGNGVKNASMGGASIALPLDANAAANNPAGMAFVPSSSTLDLQVFDGKSSADYVLPGNHLNNHQTIPAPQGGFNWQYSPSVTFGMSISGSGSGSDYGQTALPVPGAGLAKTKLSTAELIPTIAWKPREDLAVGLGLTLAHQTFSADGVIVPAPVPGGLLPIPGHGDKTATGVGWRAGVLWKPTPKLSVGVNYKATTKMGRLDGYDADLLAYSDGRIDLPEQYGVGVAWQATPQLTLAADQVKIQWGELKVMEDPNGFTWKNQSVSRLGASFAVNDRLTVRAGVSRNNGQIDSSRTAQNLLVPSVHKNAYTAGLSWKLDDKNELSAGYEINPTTTLSGTGASQGTDLTSKVQVFMLGWERKF
ncbi:OmpP1/FadL family transporter [Thiothrix eikelboomii]|uniref:OmpP1/FadL family transporter n=1 Tax=Thiothrix eikelboomii TaxID=92487 RepID=UPI003BB17315